MSAERENRSANGECDSDSQPRRSTLEPSSGGPVVLDDLAHRPGEQAVGVQVLAVVDLPESLSQGTLLFGELSAGRAGLDVTGELRICCRFPGENLAR